MKFIDVRVCWPYTSACCMDTGLYVKITNIIMSVKIVCFVINFLKGMILESGLYGYYAFLHTNVDYFVVALSVDCPMVLLLFIGWWMSISFTTNFASIFFCILFPFRVF